MSSNTYMVALYGIALSHADAQKIYKNHYNENFMGFALNPLALNDLSDDEIDEAMCGMSSKDSPYSGHSKREHTIFEMLMFTDNPNPYQEVSTIFSTDAHVQHYFGISLADSGLGDKLKFFLNDVPPEAETNYQKYVVPLLQKYNIEAYPKVVVVQQTS